MTHMKFTVTNIVYNSTQVQTEAWNLFESLNYNCKSKNCDMQAS